MRLLLDTHVLLWWLDDETLVDGAAREAIRSASRVCVSAATVWEVAIKKTARKLAAPDDLLEQIERNDFVTLPITAGHALEAGTLPLHHDDPFDRMLVAQARAETLTLVTRDRILHRYGVPVLTA